MLFTVNSGHDARAIGGPDGIAAVANKGLPLPTEQIIDGSCVAGALVTHGFHRDG